MPCRCCRYAAERIHVLRAAVYCEVSVSTSVVATRPVTKYCHRRHATSPIYTYVYMITVTPPRCRFFSLRLMLMLRPPYELLPLRYMLRHVVVIIAER